MAYGRKVYNYTLKFDADVSNARKQVQDLLNQMSDLAKNSNTGLLNSASLKTAQADVIKLGRILQQSFNIDTNKLDLTKFNRQLKQSGLTVDSLASKFAMFGKDGINAFQNLALSLSKAETPAFKLSGILDNLWITMKNTMRWQLTSSMLHGFMGTIQTANRYAEDLNESLTAIRIVTGMSTDEMSKFAQEANKAAQALNTTTVNYTDASLIYYQQGLDAEKVKERTRITIDAANAAGTSAEQMSEYLTAVWNSYQVATNQLESYVDKMAAVGASTATSLQEISTAMVNVASTANTVGVSMDQLTAIISTVASTTRQSATTIGTAYKTIFARMGDLTLGETLEDGLNLGTVSKQLSDIGVQILDVNGDLRDMGSVVEEIGDKWQIWTTAQQTAVAQAIAGKRQYTQLIALFDNWDAYQNALNISKNSEGTLAEQAQIFAEGWEAARRRVDAAAEGIYDSLINPTFWTGFDNTFAKVLNRTEDIIDSMGGLSGVVLTLGNLFLNVFGNQVANGIRTMGEGIKDLTGKQQQLNQQMREDFVNKAVEMGKEQEFADLLWKRVEILKEYEDKRKSLTPMQQKEAELELQITNFILDKVEALQKEKEKLESINELYSSLSKAAKGANTHNTEKSAYNAALKTDYADRNTFQTNFANEIKSRSAHPETTDASGRAVKYMALMEAEAVKKIQERYTLLGMIKQTESQITNLQKTGVAFEEKNVSLNQDQLEIARAMVSKLKESTESLGDKGLGVFMNLSKVQGDLKTAIDSGDPTKMSAAWETFQVQIGKVSQEIDKLVAAADSSIPKFSEMNNGTTATGQALQSTKDKAESYGKVLIDLAATQNIAGRNFDQFANVLKKSGLETKDFATKIVELGQTITSIASVTRSCTSLYETLDEVFSKGSISVQQFTAILTNLGIILPTIWKLSTMLKKSMDAATVSLAAQTAGEIADTTAKGANTIVTLLLAKANQKLALSATAVFGILAAGIAVVMAVVAIIDKHTLSQEEAAESTKNFIDAYEEAKSKLDEVANSLQNVQDKIEELEAQDSLTIVEEEELVKLKQENALLLQQKKILEEQAKSAKIAAAKDVADKGVKANSFIEKGRPQGHVASYTNEGGDSWRLVYETAEEYRKKYLEGLSENDEHFAEYHAKYMEYLEEEQTALASWNAEHIQDFADAEARFNAFMEGYLEDPELFKDNLEEQLNSIRDVRIANLGSEAKYQEVIIKPIVDSELLQEASNNIYTTLATGSEEAIQDIDISEDIKKSLLKAGISVDDFLDYISTNIERAKTKLVENIEDAESHFNELTAEDWNILADLKLDGINEWDELVSALEEHKENEVNVDVNVDDDGVSTLLSFLEKINETENPLDKALQNYAKQGHLTMDQVSELIKSNEDFAQYIVQDADGEFKINNLLYQDFLEMEGAERRALEETIAKVKEKNEVTKDYLDNYSAAYQQIQDMINEDLSNGGDLEYSYTNEEDAQRVRRLAEDLQKNTEAFKDGSKSIEEYFDTIGDYATNRIASGFEKLNAEMNGTSDETDHMEIMFSSMTGEITQGLGDINKLWKQGKITMDQYYSATLSGTKALLDLSVKQKNYLELVTDDSGNQVWKVQDERLQQAKQSAEELGDAYEGVTAEQMQAAAAQANAWQTTILEAEQMIPVVQGIKDNFEYLKDYADDFGQIEFNIENNFDITAQEFQDMCDQMGPAIANLVTQDEEMYNRLANNLRAAGVEFSEDMLTTEQGLTTLMKNDGKAAEVTLNTVITDAGATIADVTSAAGEVIEALGELIKNFNYKLEFGFEGQASGIIDWLKAAINGDWSSVKLPKLTLTGSGGDSVNNFGSALTTAGQVLKDYATSSKNGLIEEASTAPLGRNQSGLWGFGDPDDYWDNMEDILDPAKIDTDNNRKEDRDKKDKSSGSEKTPKTDTKEGSKIEEKKLKDIEDRYHVINKLIEQQVRLLQEVQTQIDRTYGAAKLKEYNKEQKKLNDLIDSQGKKMEEASGWAKSDLENMKKLGLKPELSSDGRIVNYYELRQQAADEYAAFVKEWNSHQNEQVTQVWNEGTQSYEYPKTWQQEHEELKKQMEQRYEDQLYFIQKFEESVKTYWDEFDKREQYRRDLEDNKLKKIAYVLEFQIDYKNAKKDVRNLSKAIEEAIGDALTHGMKAAMLDYQNMLDEMNMQGHYQSNFDELLAKIEESRTNQYIDQEELANQLANLRDNVIESAEALIEWAESVEDIVPDAIDAARDRFDQFTDQLEHNTSIIDTIKEIMVLQGLTIKTAQGYRDTRDMYNKRMDATLAQAKLNRQWYDNALKELQIAQTELDSATEGTQQYDILKANRDALLQQFNDAQQAMLDSAKETMETAREMYLDGVKRTAYELEQTLTKGDGFDLLQDKYDHYIDTEERYLDTVNKIYETTKLNNKIQEQLDKTTNSAHAKRLKELQEEFREREKNNKLSEYDIQIMNAKLAMLTKQMELEDAANNKSVARVVRNSRGNYDYQFTANPDELAAINQEYLDAAQEYYNIAKNQVKEVSGEIIDTWQEMTDKIKEIYEDETLTVDEREARIAEIREYYTQKVKDLEAEKQKAIKDMTEAGNIAIDEFREAHKNILDEMGGDVDNFRDIFSDDLASILENQNEFNNTFATDLDKLSEPIQNFEELFDNTINDMEDHVKEYGDKVSDVNDQVGVSYDDLKDILDQVSDSTEQVTWRGQEAVSNMWEQISAVQQLSIEYANMADQVLQAAQALRDLAQATLEAQFDRLGGAQDMTYDSDIFNDRDLYNALGGANIDYSALMSQALASGQLQYGSDTYNKLMDFRDIYYGDRGGTDRGWLTNEELDKIYKDYSSGKLTGDNLDWFNQASGNYTGPYENNLGDFLYWLEKLKIQGFATGGYTGDFDNGKLAILHEKELVLNEDDTKNILDTVNIIRNVDSSIWTTISKTLDASISMFKNALSSILTPYVKVEKDKDTLEQKVEIKAEFPNVTDSGEIIEAFDNIINVAAQYASQRD